MVRLSFTTREGETVCTEARPGSSVMQAVRDGGSEELLALCGGCCSCATCHVYVDPSFWDRVGPAGDYESDLLSASEHRTAFSRLSCQITLTPELDELRVAVAPED